MSGGGGGGPDNGFMGCFILQSISQRVVRTNLENQLDPIGPIEPKVQFLLKGNPYQYF